MHGPAITVTNTDLDKKALGPDPLIHPTATVRDSTFGRYVEIGARAKIVESHLDDYSYAMDDSNIIYTRIGKFVNIAAAVRVNPGNHPVDRATLHHFTYRSAQYGLGEDDDTFFDWRRSQPVTIGHDVWLGHGAIVLPGVTIGIGAAVGAGAVVSKDVAPYAIVAGVPARPLRQRFPDGVAEALMALAWWDWPHEKLREALPDFRGLSAEEFIEKHGGRQVNHKNP